ncbi:MAG TPA: RHS repeat-associated core domain-containing protein [Armatimonadota bacterium]
MLSSDQYDAYGHLVQGGGAAGEPFGWMGQYGYYKDPTGLYLCTFRYYDLEEARWLTPDPIGYEGGPNLYEYCDGDPVNGADSMGLSPQGDLLKIKWHKLPPNDPWHKGDHWDVTFRDSDGHNRDYRIYPDGEMEEKDETIKQRANREEAERNKQRYKDERARNRQAYPPKKALVQKPKKCSWWRSAWEKAKGMGPWVVGGYLTCWVGKVAIGAGTVSAVGPVGTAGGAVVGALTP